MRSAPKARSAVDANDKLEARLPDAALTSKIPVQIVTVKSMVKKHGLLKRSRLHAVSGSGSLSEEKSSFSGKVIIPAMSITSAAKCEAGSRLKSVVNMKLEMKKSPQNFPQKLAMLSGKNL